MLGGIFLLGCFITVVSSLRLAILMRVDLASEDYTYKMKDVLLWSIVEANVGLICACLPSLKPALRLLGLGRLLRRSQGPGGAAQSPAFIAVDRPCPVRNKGSSGGMFSSLAEITKLDDEDEEVEDTFQMVSRAKSRKDCEGSRSVIVAKRDWSVLIESTKEGNGSARPSAG